MNIEVNMHDYLSDDIKDVLRKAIYDELVQKKIKLHMEKEYVEKLIKRGDDDLSLFRRLEDIDREVLIVNRAIDRYNEVEE